MKKNIVTSFKLQVTKVAFCLLLSAFCVLLSALNAQTINYDYNPYEYAQEELFLTSPSFRERHESTDCATAIEIINTYNRTQRTATDSEKYNLLRTVSFFQCPESYAFLKEQIKTNPSETDRCNAIKFLAWMMNPDAIPCIVEYAQKSKLSAQEKAAIATAFMVFGVDFSYLGLKQQAVALLEEICFDAPIDVLESCILSYFNLGGDIAIRFFTAQLEEEEFKLYAALFLAQLGEHKPTFSIFADALNSDDNYDIHLAIIGLATIGTEEATQLILNLDPDKNRYTPKRMRWNINPEYFKKGDKQ
jgi:HEAT repeat protein